MTGGPVHRVRRTLASALSLLLALVLVGCGGGDDGEAQEIAREVCAVLAPLAEMDLDDDDFEAAFETLMELGQQLEALEERIDNAEVSEAQIEDAIIDECPDAWEAFDDF